MCGKYYEMRPSCVYPRTLLATSALLCRAFGSLPKFLVGLSAYWETHIPIVDENPVPKKSCYHFAHLNESRCGNIDRARCTACTTSMLGGSCLMPDLVLAKYIKPKLVTPKLLPIMF